MPTDDLPVMIRTRMIQHQGVSIFYPEVIGLHNSNVEQFINRTIYNQMQSIIREQYEEQDTNSFAEMIGRYEMKTNERNILSLTQSNYAIFEGAAHGLTFIRSLTFNTVTGKSYTLADLFKANSNYVKVISDIIKRQIKERDIQLLEPFTEIKPNQDFYIADKSLVIYFQLYEITPYYVGLPMFPISVFELENIIKEDGPLGIMATNN